MKLVTAFFISFFLSCSLFAVPFLNEKPVIDGKPDDAVWSKLPWISDFTKIGTPEKANVQTRFKMYHDKNNIYLTVECDEPAVGKLIRKQYSNNSSILWLNDSIELSFVPDSIKVLSFYKFMIDSRGIVTEMFGQDDNTDMEKYLFNAPWLSSIQVKTTTGNQKWTLEAAIPFGAMNFNAETGNQWRINVARNRYAGEKTPELSSWAVLPRKNHVMPKAFRKVTLEQFSPKKYLFDIENLNGQYKRNPNGTFVYDVNATIHNNTGSFAILREKISLNAAEGNQTSKSQKRVHLQASAYQKESGSVENVKSGNYLLAVDLWSNQSSPVLLKRITRPVSLEYSPLSIRLLRPAYRNNIYATMPDKTIEAEIALKEYQGIPLTLELSGNGVKETRIIPASSSLNKVTFDGKKLPYGKYLLRVSGKKDAHAISDEVRIRVLPYQKGEVWLDSNGVTHVDGKPFFPYGWYASHGVKKPWYNSNLIIARYGKMEGAFKEIRDNLTKLGQRTIVLPFQDLHGRNDWSWVIFKDPDTRKKGLTPEQRKKIEEFVSAVGKEDGVLAWYMADEPECRDNNPVWYEEAYELIAELDPYHPCIMLNWGPDGIRKYYKGCDILLPDCYPQYFEDGSTGHSRWIPSDWAKTSTALRPAWQMPLMTLWPSLARDGKTRGVPADYHDQRSQFFQALIHNVKGFNMYAYFDSQRFSSFIIGPDEIGKTLMTLQPYLLRDTVPDGVSFRTQPHKPNFQAGLKTLNQGLCMIGVNTSLDPLKVSFQMKNSYQGKLHVAGENRSVNVKNGAFTDTFPPNATHVYLTDEKMANVVPSVQKTIDAINAHRTARKKTGNLIATGELLEADYKNITKGKLPPGAPLIKASSDWIYYATRETGSLYYLVDGLIAPNRVENTYSPKAEDKAPWLKFTLPASKPMKELKLYTPDGNLISCRVTTSDGRCYMVKDNKDNVISVKLSGKENSSIKIEFLERKTQKNDSANRLLTEVELY